MNAPSNPGPPDPSSEICRRTQSCGNVLLGGLFLFLSSVIGSLLFWSYFSQLGYEPVEGTIVKSELEPCVEGMFSADITFSYRVDGRLYVRGKYRDGFGVTCLSRDEVKQILKQYPPGTLVQAWYDPNRPERAVLDRSLGMMQKIFLAVIGAFAGAFLLFVIPAWKKNSRRR